MGVEVDRRGQIYERLGSQIRRARRPRTQEWLAGQVDADQRTISGYESGRVRVPVDVLAAIAAACEVSVVDLLVGAGLARAEEAPVYGAAESAIRSSPELDDDGRALVLHALDYCRQATERAVLNQLTDKELEVFKRQSPERQRVALEALVAAVQERDLDTPEAEPRGA